MSYAFDEPLAYSPWNESGEERELAAPSKPLSGPGSSRQTRRLQLRNAGFRGSAVPTRKVTPKSVSSGSLAWSAASGILSGSDAENVSPMGVKADCMKVNKRRSSGVLQEIDSGSNTLTRPKSARPRVTSRNLFAPFTSDKREVTSYQNDPMSPPPPKNAIRAKSMRASAKMNKTRRSVSGEARMYIDHLESELAQTQEQLRAVNSPTVTRQQSSKLRTLNAETSHLLEELTEWEQKYDQRIQEIVDEHTEIETGLRKQVRKLEQDAEESRYRLQELEIEVAAVRQAAETAEAANVNLERRLEIMSEILATSPTKIELHAVTPGMQKKHQRPKSMLPRFPTASALYMSPERQGPQTQPPSPLTSFPFPSPFPEPSSSQSESLSDTESVFSEAPTNGGSTTSLDQPTSDPFNPWTVQAVQAARARPARRMRRFGPGSHGPRALILPSTAGCEAILSSAPPLERCEMRTRLERSETVPGFSFPVHEREGRGMGLEVEVEEGGGLSEVCSGRRRASTVADQSTLDHLAASPFPSLSRPTTADQSTPDRQMAASSFLSPSRPSSSEGMLVEERGLGVRFPSASDEAEQRTPMRDFSSLGTVAGKNLMDELCAVRTNEGSEGSGDVVGVEEGEGVKGEGMRVDLSPDVTNEEDLLAAGRETQQGSDVRSLLTTDITTFVTSSPSPSTSSTNTNTSISTTHPSTFPRRLRNLFSDLWTSPVALARHLIQTASARIRIPAPLRNAQWWLVGMLLGPMAKRRLLHGSPVQPTVGACRACAEETAEEGQGLLYPVGVSGDDDDDEGLGYGTFCPSSPAAASPGTIGGTRGRHDPCQHATSSSYSSAASTSGTTWSRHSPWMWLKFSFTLAFAVGVAFKDGPASLMRRTVCGGCRSGGQGKSGKGLAGRRRRGRVVHDVEAEGAGVC